MTASAWDWNNLQEKKVQEELQMELSVRVVVLIFPRKMLLGFALRVDESGSRELQRTQMKHSIFRNTQVLRYMEEYRSSASRSIQSIAFHKT
jgi:hypothetical protein